MAHLVARAWLALVLAGLVVVAAGIAGRVHPLPDYGPAETIIDEQMKRSHRISGASVLVLGDSSALYGVDPGTLEAGIGIGPVESLAAIGPARPVGYATLLRNYLRRQPAPRIVVLLLHPLALIHGMPPHKGRETRAIVQNGWPPDAFGTGARKTLNRHLFGGFLEEPMPGQHGRHYGNTVMLARALWAGHGTLVHPARARSSSHASAAGPGMTYSLHADAVRDLRAAGTILQQVDANTLYVGLAPVPASIAGDAETASRQRMLARITKLLGLAPLRALDLPNSLPDADFVELTHVGAAGRARYSRALVPILQARLAASVAD